MVRNDRVKATGEILREALKNLGPNGEHWIKGTGEDGFGGMCASRAIIDAEGPEAYYRSSLAWHLLAGLVGSSIPEWNDKEETTFEDVKRVFKKAIDIADRF